ncbi:MAG: hypothetical protein ACEPOW_01330 [Bacteroidales bacterium]
MKLKSILNILFLVLMLLGASSVYAQSDLSYQDAITAANKYFDKEDYQNAKAYYQIALQKKPDDKIAKSKLKESISLLRGAMEKKYAYQDQIDIADKYFEEEDYLQAVDAYKVAKSISPNETYPNQQIAKANKLHKENAEKRVEFDKLKASAQEAFDKKDYDNAIDLLENALDLFDKDKETKQQIEEIEDVRDKYEKDKRSYGKYIRRADYLYSRKRYKDALEQYMAANKVFPDEEVPMQRIKELPSLIDQQYRYDRAVDKADSLYVKKEFRKSKAFYEQALEINPEENFPQSMISKIDDKFLANEKAVEEDYQKAIFVGDSLFVAQNWESAQNEFALAKSIKPDEEYPKLKLEEIESRLAAKRSDESSAAQFEALLTSAQSLFNDQKYKEAKSTYEEALNLRPEDQEVLAKVKEIENLITNLAADKENQEKFEKAMAQGDEFLMNKAYQKSVDAFKFAVEIYPDNELAVSKLKIAQDELEANTLSPEMLEKYNSLITKGDEELKVEKLEEARSSYMQAIAIKSSDPYPQTQILTIDAKIKAIEDARSKEENYNIALKKATEFMLAEKFYEARNQYNKALKIYPDKTDIADKLKSLNVKITAIEKQMAIDKAFNSAMNNGETSFKVAQYSKAKKFWEQAITIKPNDNTPKEKLQMLKEKLEEIAREKAILKQFNGIVAQAKDLKNKKQYKKSLELYESANKLKPNYNEVDKRIAEVKKIIADLEELARKKKEYDAFIVSADKFLETKAYNEALVEFEKAQKVFPKETYPKSQINKIKATLAEIERQKKIDAAYKLAMDSASQFLANEKWGEARSKFNEAVKLKPKMQEPRVKIKEIDQKLEEMRAEIERKFKTATLKADRAMVEENYKIALENYRIASNLKPKDVMARKKVNDSQSAYNAQLKALMDAYDQSIGLADNYYNTRAYDRAITAYEEARDIKPDEAYPVEMIKKITDYLEKNAIVSLNSGDEAIPSNTTKTYKFTPVPTKVRKSNFLLVRAKTDGNSEVKVQVSYGKDGSKNGGAILTIKPGKDTRDYLIRIGSQYKWFSQDNNWLSFYPQNGNVTFSLVQVSKTE